MKEYKIEIAIDTSKEKLWEEITNFKNYPNWNTVLAMTQNDGLIVGKKFSVTIFKPNGKQSNFKATAIGKKKNRSFSAKQKIIGDWFFSATHHFIIQEIDIKHVLFIQHWELKGIIASLFRKQIFDELEGFNQMNTELKDNLENN